MGFRFSKRISLFPGVKVNLGLGGVSTTFGGRGASVNVGSRGVYGRLSVPGTGLSYSQRLDAGSSQPVYATQRERKAIERHQRLQSLQKELKIVNVEINLDSGDLIMTGSAGDLLSPEASRYAFQNGAEKIADMLQAKIDELNETEKLFEIHMDAPDPSAHPCIISDFPEAAILPPGPAPSARTPIPKLGFFESLFPWVRKGHQKAEEASIKRYESAVLQHGQAVENFQRLAADQKLRRQQWNQEQLEKQANFDHVLRTDISLMDGVLSTAFENLDWPRETLVSYQFVDQGQSVYLDVDLPEIEDLPQREYSMAANRRKAIVKNRSATRLREDYNRHIHGIAFRLAAVTLANLPAALTVFISGYSQRRDKSTGHINDEYLFSYQVSREGMMGINFDDLDHVEPAQALARFPSRINQSSTSIFKPITPFSPD